MLLPEFCLSENIVPGTLKNGNDESCYIVLKIRNKILHNAKWTYHYSKLIKICFKKRIQ